MTLHHVQNIQVMFYKLYAILNNSGIIAISDLEKEDASGVHKRHGKCPVFLLIAKR
jgi:hypothetical protein